MYFLLIISVFVSVTFSKHVLDYHERIGIPLARELYKFEKEQNKGSLGRLSRIVNGDSAVEGQLPFAAGIDISIGGSQSFCSGTLLTNTKVVTAGHCWKDSNSQASGFKIVLGSLSLYGSDGVRVDTEDVVAHEDFKPESSMFNDIAIATIKHVDFTDLIKPAALPTDLKDTFAGKTALVAGIGVTEIGEAYSLKYVNRTVLTNEECAKVFNFIKDQQICTSGEDGKGPCNGDSGGSLVYFDANSPVLIGVTTFVARSGCLSGKPAGYTRVTHFVPWIKGKL